MLNKITLCVGSQYKSSSGAEQKKTDIFSTQPLKKVCFANRNIGQFCLKVLYSVSFNFGHICRWDQCAVYILYSKISTDLGLLKIRHSHRFVAVIIQILIPNFYYLGSGEFCNNAIGQFFSYTRFSRAHNIKIISIHRDFFIIVLQTDSVGSRLLKVHLVFLLYFDCCFYVVFL